MSVAVQSRPVGSFTTKPLGEVFDVVGGGTPPKNNASYFNGNIPWATIRDMQSDVLAVTEHTISEEGLRSSSAKLIPAGEVIMASRVGLGKACILQRDTAINQDIRALLPLKPNTVDRRFCLYWLQSVKVDIVAAGTGATVQGIKLPFIKSLPFPDVPIEEQKRIVAVLDQAFTALDRARALAEANLTDLENLSASASRAVFDGVGGDWLKLGDLCEIYQPKTISAKDLKPDGAYIVFGANGPIGRYDKFNHEAPQLLVTCRGATCGSVNISEPFSWITGNAMVVRPKDDRISVDYLEQFFRGAMDWNTVITGAAQPQITRQSLAPSLVPVPERHTQDQQASALKGLQDKFSLMESQIKAKLDDIASLRQSFLQKAFAGELT